MRVSRRRVGRDGPELPLLALGSWQTWDRIAFEDAVALVRRAAEAGVDLFDVGHYNVGPHSEGSYTDVLFGRIAAAAGLAREDYALCQKLWLWRYPEQPLAEQLERCLFRVGSERAELVVVGDFVGELDIPAVVAEMGALVRDGSVGAWGVNNWAAADLEAAHAFATRERLAPPRLAQLKYSVCRRSIPEGDPYRRLFDELGIGLQASDVLEGGILAGKANPERRIGMDPGEIRERIRARAPELARIAADFDATPAQLAVAFCLTHPATANVLVGVSRLEQLEQNLGAVELAERHGEEIRARLADFWLDREAVAPDASWGATRAAALAAARP